MTERTVARMSRVELDDDDDDDSISVTSSRSEEYSSDQEFLVERILAEKREADNKTYYLISWAGYPEEKSTWEPKKNIQDPDILTVWQERKDLEDEGSVQPFNLVGFNARILGMAKAKAERRKRRMAKRKRLSVPVSPSETLKFESTRYDDDSDSVEAVEVNEPPEDSAGIGRKEKLALGPRRRRVPQAYLPDIEPIPRRGKAKEKVDESESSDFLGSDSIESKKRARREALLSLRQKRSTQKGSKAPDAPDQSTVKKTPNVSKEQRPGASSAPESRSIQPQRHQIPPKPPVPASSSTINKHITPISSTEDQSGVSHGGKSIRRDSPTARGKGATRGSVVHRNVFSRREPQKKRPTLLETSSDPTKDPKRYTNWHITRKAQLAGREIADAAPDLSVLGGLFDPSKPGSMQPLKPATLRRPSFPKPGPQNSNASEPSTENAESYEAVNPASGPGRTRDVEHASATLYTEAPSQSASGRPIYVNDQHGHRAICFFWHSKGSCLKGDYCSFIHSDNMNLPIAPPPSKSAVRPVPSRPAQDSHNTICKFWSSSDSRCSRGNDCNYAHGEPANRPPAPGQIRLGRDIPRANLSGQFEDEDRQRQQEEGGPQGGRRVEHQDLQPSLSWGDTSRDNKDALTQAARPHWDAKDPFQSICYFWYHMDYCIKGDACSYFHSDQIDLPIAPNPSSKSRKVSRFRPEGTRYPEDRIEYELPTKPTTDSSASTRLPEAPAVGAVRAVPRKTVSFANYDPDTVIVGELETASVINELPPSAAGEADRSFLSHKASATLPLKTKPAIKMNMEDYWRQKAMKTPGSGVKEIILGINEPQSIMVDFGEPSEEMQQIWGQSFSTLRKLQFRQMCAAQDFESLRPSLQRQPLWNGSLVPASTVPGGLEKINKVSQQLKLCFGGLMSVFEGLNVLLYPAIEEWKFIDPLKKPTLEDGLRYFVFQPALEIGKVLTPKAPTPTLYKKTLAKNLYGLSYRQLLNRQKMDRVHHFYLLFPSSANKTAEFFASWLRASDSRCKVYSSQTQGSWDFFSRSRSVEYGVVLMHESAIAYIHELPSLYSLIAPTGNRMFTFWCVGDSSDIHPIVPTSESSTLGQITVNRILPHGHAFFLAPSFFIAEPERAYNLIRWSCDRIRNATAGTWKLVCAYGIRDYLLDLALEKSDERDSFYEVHHNKPAKDAMAAKRGLSYQACEARFKCHAVIADMLSRSIENGSSDYYDSDQVDEISCPIIQADKGIDPDDEQALVTWFAGWSITKVDQFRKYTVVGTSSASQERAVRVKEIMAEGTIHPDQSNLPNPAMSSAKDSNLVSHTPGSPPGSGKPALSQAQPNSSPHSAGGIKPFNVSQRKQSRPKGSIDPFDGNVDMNFRKTPHPNSRLPSNPNPGLSSDSSRNTLTAMDITSKPEASLSTLRQEPGYEMDAQIDDLIASVRQDRRRDLPRLATADVNRTVFTDTPVSGLSAASLAQRAVIPSEYSPATGGLSPFSPPQFDSSSGAGSPRSAIGGNSSGPGVATDERGRFASGLRSKGTGRKEANSPVTIEEDGNVHPSRRRAMQSQASSQNNSRRESNASLSMQSLSGEKMDLDSPQQGTSVTFSANASTSAGTDEGKSPTMKERNRIWQDVRYEATTTWYRRLKAEGKGWEHIYLEGWEKAFKNLGVSTT